MKTAVDTNVLLDVLATDSNFGESSAAAITEASLQGELVVCEMVYSELAAAFGGERRKLDAFLRDLNIDLLPSTRGVLSEVGRMWRSYRDQRGSRTRILADFFIGAHARLLADHLLTRDRGFYRDWFQGLSIRQP